MDLSLIQKDILITLITLYEQKSAPIKGEEIAQIIQRNPGTVRNQMQALKTSGLVDGISGPRGGYHPTTAAFNLLNLPEGAKNAEVQISRNGVLLHDIRVLKVSFTTLSYADICHGVIQISGSVREFAAGDLIIIGPTPVNKLMLSGEVFGKDESEKTVIVSIFEMASIPRKPISNCMSSPIKVFNTESVIYDALSLFVEEHIHGAPVIDKNNVLCGMVSMSDILRAGLKGASLQAPITSIMNREVITVDASTQLDEVIALFKEKDIGRFVVMKDNAPVGIITRSDTLRALQTLHV
ncbi:MAG: CBS domain-containing protein [Methanomicrobiales archaeon]|jgi:predicted transcriptional regulator|nr:CBS domain-containing protein [Methanomicrobiales archaeon]